MAEGEASALRAVHHHRNPHRRVNLQRPALTKPGPILVTDQRANFRVRHTRHLLAHRQLEFATFRAQLVALPVVVHGRMDARLPPEAVQRSGRARHHLRYPGSTGTGPTLAEVRRIGVAPQRVDIVVRPAGHVDAVLGGLGGGGTGDDRD